MRLQTRDMLMNGRWRSTIACENQVDPGVQDAIWQTIMAHDPIGSVWGPSHGVMRVRTSAGSWGWNRELAAKVEAPTLILENGRPWVAIGTPGGHTIPQTVPQMGINLIDFGMDVQEAVDVGRVAFVDPDRLLVGARVAESTRNELEAVRAA